MSSSREVRAEDPENYHSIQIAQSLLHYGDHLWRSERFEEAIDAFQQCVVACDLYMESALTRHRQDPNGGLIELVRAHNERNIALLRLEVRHDAFHHSEECVKLLRNAIPRISSHLTINLAVYLRGYGMALSRKGRFQESCEAFEEAASINRAHYRLNPLEHHTNLARTLYSYSSALCSLGRYEDACVAGAESVELVRKLPVYYGILIEIGFPLHKLWNGMPNILGTNSSTLMLAESLWRPPTSIVGNMPCIRSRPRPNERNVSGSPGACFLVLIGATNFAYALRRYGWCLFQMGRVVEALAALREAAQRFQNLIEAGANDLRQFLALTHRSMAGCLFALELYEDSRDSSLLALGLYEHLDEQRPGQYGESLSYSMWHLARSYERLDQPEAAWNVLVKEGAVQRPFTTGMYPPGTSVSSTGCLVQYMRYLVYPDRGRFSGICSFCELQ